MNEGPWNGMIETLEAWDPQWAAACRRVAGQPWSGGVLPRRLVELISVMLAAQCTSLDPEATRRHVRAAIEAGATRDQILLVLKCASLGAIHSMSLGAPVLLEEARAAGASLPDRSGVATPNCDRMRAIGQWNTAWDPFYALDPAFTEAFFAAALPAYASGIFTAREIELLSIAFDASYTHLYAPGTRRHVKAALAAGATVEEVTEVLKLCVVHGIASLNLGVPVLAEELERAGRAG